MIKTNYISVAEFIEYNPELDYTNHTEATISGMIRRASANVDNFLGYTLSVEDMSQEKKEVMIDSQGNLLVYADKFPIISISSLSFKQGTISINLGLQDGAGRQRYDISGRGTYVQYPYSEITTTGTVSIRNFLDLRGRDIFTLMDYRAGYETIPDDIKDAVNLYVKDIFIRQANPLNISSMTQGGISIQFKSKSASNNANDNGDSEFIKMAKQVLYNYRRVVEI